jgi:2,5-diketo-D-gluconate reductase A
MIGPRLPFTDGRSIPQVGFGVWEVAPDVIVATLLEALNAGYRCIDTAALYGNEEGVGEAVRTSGVPREEIFVTTKVWNDRHGDVRKAFDESMARLQFDYVDLYLIHWPAPSRGQFVQAWKALIELQKEGRVRSIGVSNFKEPHIREVIAETGIKPVLNQIELHPLFPQRKLREFNAANGIVTQSWSPLGKGRLDHDPTLTAIGAKHGKNFAQVILRWQLQLGIAIIPRSITPSRIRENVNLFDFELDGEDMAKIAALETGERLGDDPDLNR